VQCDAQQLFRDAPRAATQCLTLKTYWIVIPAQAGIQQKQTARVADSPKVLSRLRGRFLIIWIPAFAGMTG
jgi:hypothetical protein